MKVKLKPFQVPNFVIQDMEVGSRADGHRDNPTHALHKVPKEVLEEMCAEFTASVLAKGDPANQKF